MTYRSSLARLARDKPQLVTLGITVLVVINALFGHYALHVISPGRALVKHSSPGDAAALFLGGATVAAMVAGLAGVVVVFALSAPGKRVRTFRLKGGQPLLSNWTSAVVVSFIAALLCLIASFLRLIDARGWGWLFELAVLLQMHAAVRLIWLLRKLAEIVAAEDRTATEDDEAIDVNEAVRSGDEMTA